VPIERPDDQRRALIRFWHKVPVYARAIGGVENCYASRQPGEAWFTLFTTTEHSAQLADGLRELFGVAPDIAAALENGGERRLQTRATGPGMTDPILGPDLAWYRSRLHQVSDIALTIRDDPDEISYRLLRVALDTLPDPARLDPSRIPATLYENELRRRLVVLAGAAMERVMANTASGSTFWADFARWPHRNAEVLSPPGHWLWNLLR
jgi:hypothetical protein